MSYRPLISKLWGQYVRLTPLAERINSLFLSPAVGETSIVNDHIAFRTWGTDLLGINCVSRHFERYNYRPMGEYHFRDKHLNALHFEHSTDASAPKIFISELILSELSPFAQEIAHSCSSKVSPAEVDKDEFLISGSKPWAPLSHATYLKLLQESEYAAWLYSFGFCANHFTVLVNSLSSPFLSDSLQNVNNLLKSNGFILNASGGEIKGSPHELLEQSSSLADRADVTFNEGTFSLPSCYYEFAKRYPIRQEQPDVLYSGFVAASADKIFESTDVKETKQNA